MTEISLDTVTLGLIWFVVFLFSTTCHEGAHALVAKLGEDMTAGDAHRYRGRCARRRPTGYPPAT